MGRSRTNPDDMDLEMTRGPHGIQFFVGTQSSTVGQLQHSLEYNYYREGPAVVDVQYSLPVHTNVEKTI